MPRRTLLLSLLLLAGCIPPLPTKPPPPDEIQIPLGEFSLTERSGKTITQADLRGKVWVASFIFTRCAGPCTRVTAVMAQLQAELKEQPDFRLVSFTVDPEHDQPAVLTEYGNRFGADAERWLFLTGKPETVYKLIRDGFKLYAEPAQGAERMPGNEVNHDTRLAIIDKKGDIRAYVHALEKNTPKEAENKIRQLLRENP